jgi:hypothetical protein
LPRWCANTDAARPRSVSTAAAIFKPSRSRAKDWTSPTVSRKFFTCTGARYEFPIGDYRAFFQAGGTHQGNSYSATGNVPSYDQPGYTLYDASLGVAKDAWTAQLFGQNLTNVLASTFANSPQWIVQEAVTRPRVAGVKFSYKFQ